MTDAIESADAFARRFVQRCHVAPSSELNATVAEYVAAVRAEERAKTLRECERALFACQCWTINAARLRDVFVLAIRSLKGWKDEDDNG